MARDYSKSRNRREIQRDYSGRIRRIANAGSSDYFCPLVECPICGGNDGVCCYIWDGWIPFKSRWRKK